MSDEEDDDVDGTNETESTNADPSYRRQTSIPKLLEGSAVPIFLESYGFGARTAMDWSSTPPELRIMVSGHSVSSQKTWYHIDCSLATGKEPLQWRVALRLKHLRKGLHDLVKPQLGSSYPTYFHRIPFAHRGRPAGTTSRLDAWCQRLAKCISSKLVPPLVAAAVLRLTAVPEARTSVSVVKPGHSSAYSPDKPVVSVADDEKTESHYSVSSPSFASPDHEGIQDSKETYFPVKYKSVELPHVELPVARLSASRLLQPGPSSADDVIADLLDDTFDDDEDESDVEDITGNRTLTDCADVIEEVLSAAPDGSLEPQACLEGTSTCTGGGPSDSDSSDSSEDSGHEGAARVGKALRKVTVGKETSPEGKSPKSPLQRRMSERRKLTDAQAFTSGETEV
jgi:hypothetical protein